jgi:hypothetical protein
MFSSECLASQQFRKTGINKFLNGGQSNCNKNKKPQYTRKFNKIIDLILVIQRLGSDPIHQIQDMGIVLLMGLRYA